VVIFRGSTTLIFHGSAQEGFVGRLGIMGVFTNQPRPTGVVD
jgi:hypothetical protein